MVVLWKVSTILFCFTLTKFGLISCVLYVESGTSLSLDPGMTGTPDDILWTFNGNKLAERDLSDFQEYGKFMNRTEIDFTTGRLIVHRMTRDDSGFYKVMIQINGKLQYYEEHVKVIDGVPEPQVTCEVNSSSQSRHLRCSMTDGINVMYTWTGPNGLQSSQTLEIDKDEPSESLYICTVNNPVSQKNKSIILKDCSTDGLNLPLIVPLVIISVIIVGASALIFYFRWRRNKGKQKSREGADGMGFFYSSLNQNEDGNQRSRNDHDGDQNREQRVNEDEGTLNNEGAVTRTQDSDGNTDENLSEQIKDVQSESEQIHESDQNRFQRVHEDEGRNEGVNMINQETKSKTDGNISEQNNGVQSEQFHESDVNKRSRDVDDGEQNRVQGVHEGTLNNERVNMINQETKSNTDKNMSEQKNADIQSKSEQFHESDVNKRSRDDHDGDQNRVQGVHEETLNNEGAGVMIQETKSKTDGNISEQNNGVQSEQIHESENSKEVKDEELKMSSDRRESVDTNEQTDCINKDSQSENCSEEHSEQQEEGNFQDQSEHLHDSANDSNQSINHDEDEDEDGKQIMSKHIETSKEEEEGNTDEGAEENIPEKSEDASTSIDSEEQQPFVKKRVMDIENRYHEHKS